MSDVLVSVLAGAAAGAAACLAVLKVRTSAPNRPSAPAQGGPPPAPEIAHQPPQALVEPEHIPGILQPLIKALTGPAEEVGDPRELLDMSEFQAVLAVMRWPDAPLALLRQHALGANWPVACAALVALSERPDRQSVSDDIVRHLADSRPYVLPYAFGYLVSLEQRPPIGTAVLGAPVWWQQNPVIAGYIDEYFRQSAALGDEASFGDRLKTQADLQGEAIRGLLKKVEHPFAAELTAILDEWLNARIDRAFLGTVGTLWNPAEPDPLLVEPAEWRNHLEAAEFSIRQPRPRSVLVTGDARTGKTAFIELLGARLHEDGWTLFTASGAELMAGQIYFGQLEERLRQVLDALHARRRLVWYAPDFAHLAESGSHKGQAASILDQVLPAIAAGNLVVIGEASQTAATRLFQLRPSLRTLMDVTPLEPMSEKAAVGVAHELCRRIGDHTGLEISPMAVAAAADLAQQYLGVRQSPGAVLELLKRTAAKAVTEEAKLLSPEGLVTTLSQLSGLPAAILDTGQRVDLAEIRSFFSRRVIGQDEAVRTLVDRIAMLKAGLLDPDKPIGVFLFAGPTGTGKTELAKTLAEFLFGSADRMTRLDMSEFQHVESTAKILGQRGETSGDSLIDRVRKQPFSVVLLDEFEKAHSNCWDLFLQIFDDGRLTDANGREADFRHCIIILTSNLGATAHRGGAIGFGQQTGGFADDQVLRTINQTFRPEFINRLDKIVVFQPLSRDLMRSILNKELADVLERRGLRDRDWAVEWEASALEFLLDRGFSPEMGARPLKRAIDQHLLAPLAATMVEHRAPAGDQFLFVRSNGAEIEVEFVDPDASGPDDAPLVEPAAGADLSLAEIVLRPLGSAEERDVLTAAWRELSAELASDPWQARAQDLRLQLADPAIWSRDDRVRMFSAAELADRIEQAALTAERLLQRYTAGGAEAGQPSRVLSGRVALQLYNIREGMQDLLTEAPIDVALCVEAALDAGDGADGAKAWLGRLTAMYRQWAAKRRMQLREIPASAHWPTPVLLITGFGAYRTVAREGGLHVLEEDGPDGARRTAARVVAAPGPDPVPGGSDELRSIAARLAAAPRSSAIVRRYRDHPAPLVRDIAGEWRSGRLSEVMGGDFDLIGAVKRRSAEVA